MTVSYVSKICHRLSYQNDPKLKTYTSGTSKIGFLVKNYPGDLIPMCLAVKLNSNKHKQVFLRFLLGLNDPKLKTYGLRCAQEGPEHPSEYWVA